ncbi:MAG: hypothetical protein WBB37_07535 [bacterium]
MSLAFKEAKLGLADTGVEADALTITDISKPGSPQITENQSIPYEIKTSICNECKVKRVAGQVDLNFTNLDGVDPHTIYYQIYADGELIVDRSTGFSIGAGSTLAKTELIYQVDPADEDVTTQIYLWADEASQIRLDDHRVRCGIGVEQETKAVEIEKDYQQAVYAEFATTGASYDYKLKAKYSGVVIKEGTDTALSICTMFPYTELHLVPQADKFVYITGISLV